MKTTQKLFIINAAVTGSFILGIAGVSAQATCTSDSQCGAGFKCVGTGPKICTPDCGGTILPNTAATTQAPAPMMGYTGYNPAATACNQLGSGTHWVGTGAMIGTSPATAVPMPGEYCAPNETVPSMPRMSPGSDLKTPVINNTAGGANVLSALWGFLTHRK